MNLFGLHVGYDEPFWYFGRWEFLLHDRGWVICYRRVQKWAGAWPRYCTIHWGAERPHGGQPRNVEEEALRWLERAYRGTDTDDKKFTRWNMVAAYAAGKEMGQSEPTPSRPTN